MAPATTAPARCAPVAAPRRAVVAARTATRRGGAAVAAQPAATAAAPVAVADAASATVQGTSRKVNEDRSVLQPSGTAAFSAFAAVYDGHGGAATADWLVANLAKTIDKFWAAENGAAAPAKALASAFLAADRKLLAPGGFMGMGERGIGGAKCGSTAAIAGILADGPGGAGPTVVAANVGDARVLLVTPDGVTQLTVDHVPDAEEERTRIERFNPNPKLPLVRFVGGTWRCGGILALSRAMGDAYMKGALQFEGVSFSRADAYASGFGVIAQPDVSVTPLTGPRGAAWVVVASDGLFSNPERGGGGGLSNEEVRGVVAKVSVEGGSAEGVAGALTRAAQAAGSTDDVTVVCMRV